MLTPDLGFTNADANLGFEGVAYVPDTFLVASGLHRPTTATLYNPADYPGQGEPGLFFGAVEKTGHLRAYVLNTDHTLHPGRRRRHRHGRGDGRAVRP